MFIKTDTTTLGNWNGAYGKDGYGVISENTKYPGYANVTPLGVQQFVWEKNTLDIRGLQKPVNLNQRVAAAWYVDESIGAFSVDVFFSDNGTHQLALYVVDWDSSGRSEKIEIVDTTNRVLDTRTVTNFVGGQYLVWNITGHVVVRFTNLHPGSNAVVSGLFFR